MALVSIITPLYNCESVINQTFNSVINQTFNDWEWIVVDDCSTDNSFELFKKLSKSDNRITLLQTKENGGSAVARNIGLKKATGKYITFLDADDMLDNSYLEEQLRFIKENGPLVSAAYRRKTERSCTEFFVPSSVDYKTALKGNPLSCLTTMYDRDVIGEVFFPEDIDRPEDYVFWLNILKRGFIAKGNPKVLGTYVLHLNSKSSNKLKLIRYQYRVYHKTQGFNFFKSWFYVVNWAFYGKRKYKNVK